MNSDYNLVTSSEKNAPAQRFNSGTNQQSETVWTKHKKFENIAKLVLKILEPLGSQIHFIGQKN